MKPRANIQVAKQGGLRRAELAVALGCSSKVAQACIDQTQPPTEGQPEVDGATQREESKNALRDDISSPVPCNPNIKKAVGKAQGVEKVSNGQTDALHRRGKHNPAQAGAAGNCHKVLVLSHQGSPAMPCAPARARQLLKAGKAAVFKRFPFTIILKQDKPIATQPITCKIDPGSRHAGIVLVAQGKTGNRVVFAIELQHRGHDIRDSLLARRQLRRGRRSRHTRYRPSRFDNRTKPKGWLPPSIQHRCNSTMTWVNRLRRYTPVTGFSIEHVKFDTQLMENPDISGVEYQQGTLAGYEVRQYILEKWGHECAYCKTSGVQLYMEHMTPRARGGTDRPSNLCPACKPCNEKKGTKTASEFGYPSLQPKPSGLRDAAAANSIRWEMVNRLKALDLPLECGSGGRTKFNRTNQGYPKAHWIDAACVGVSGETVALQPASPYLVIQAHPRNNRRMCQPDKFGFPNSRAKRSSRVHGFTSGDLVSASVPKGKNRGSFNGRIATRANGYFRVGPKDGVSFKHCTVIQHNDGYSYHNQRLLPTHKGMGFPAQPNS